ncbi:hypothetical protein QAD02_007822 [Eretmocerus hayati]|uniref:Uncharacterized protein n=1 Tax=Eretmocerus hayati TaxID=131215 RepID=A0ACC2N4R2_9HYME|nr:hypothetical protein QAD02_007822 [Eretmocerus hayati]
MARFLFSSVTWKSEDIEQDCDSNICFQENFYVVEHEFKVKDEEPGVLLSLAHIDWLDLENDKAHLPPTKLLRNKKLFENPPSADKVKKWTLHECKQLIGPLDYFAAWEESKEMSGKSGVSEQEEGDTEDDSGVKKSRKRKVPIRFSPPLKDSILVEGENIRFIKNGFKTLHEEIQNVNAKVGDFLEKPNKRLSKQAKLLPKFPLKGAKGVVALERKLAKEKFREIFVSIVL